MSKALFGYMGTSGVSAPEAQMLLTELRSLKARVDQLEHSLALAEHELGLREPQFRELVSVDAQGALA